MPNIGLIREPSPTACRRLDAMPQFYMLATPPQGLIRWLELQLEARACRRKLSHLLDYEDHILEDMGYTRAELLMALELPLKADVRKAMLQWKTERRQTG